MKPLLVTVCAALVLASAAKAAEMVQAEAGVLRWIDRLTGESGDMELARGQSATNGRLTIMQIGRASCRERVCSTV